MDPYVMSSCGRWRIKAEVRRLQVWQMQYGIAGRGYFIDSYGEGAVAIYSPDERVGLLASLPMQRVDDALVLRLAEDIQEAVSEHMKPPRVLLVNPWSNFDSILSETFQKCAPSRLHIGQTTRTEMDCTTGMFTVHTREHQHQYTHW